MNKELAVILSAMRDSAIALGMCLKLSEKLNVSSCSGVKCLNCPLFQSPAKTHYFDSWASVASPLTIEVNYEQRASINTVEY